MENRRLHKLGTKLLLISIGVLLIIAGSIFIYFQVFYTKSYGCVFSDNRIENGCNNEQANLNSRLWQIGDKLYYSYRNHLFRNGVYEITPSRTDRVYYDWSPFECSVFNYNVYQEKLIKPFVEMDNTLQNYDLVHHQDQPLFSFGDEELFHSAFVVDGKLYLTSESDNTCIFRYDDKDEKTELVASPELCAFDYYPMTYRGNLMYYCLDSEMPGAKNLYQYDMFKKETVWNAEINETNSIRTMIAQKDKVYNIAYDSNSFQATVYEVDLSTKAKRKLYETEDNIKINGSENQLFLENTAGECKGIYKLDASNGRFELIFDDEEINLYQSLYLIDNDWGYFTDIHENLYSVKQDGSDYQTVFSIR